MREKVNGLERIEGHEHRGIVGDVPEAHSSQCGEPDESDGPEEGRNPARTLRLDKKKAEDDDQREGQHVGLEIRRDDVEALDGGEHGDRRRDDGVAIEQRRPDHAEHRDPCDGSAEGALRQRHEGERAALALIVGIEQDEDIFDSDDEDERPDDEGENAMHQRLRYGTVLPHARENGLAQRIERACTDVAIDDTDATQCENEKARRPGAVTMICGFVRSLPGVLQCGQDDPPG